MLRRLLDRLAAWPLSDRILLGLVLAALAAAPLSGVALIERRGPDRAIEAEVRFLDPAPNALPYIEAEALMIAVHADPFRADRSAPAWRYRLAESTSAPSEGPRGAAGLPVPSCRLLGTAISEEARLAVLDGLAARRGAHVYRLGDTIEAFVLTEIAGDSIVLSGPDAVLVLKIQRPWKS